MKKSKFTVASVALLMSSMFLFGCPTTGDSDDSDFDSDTSLRITSVG